MENNFIKEEWFDGVVMMSPRPQYNHIKIVAYLNDIFRTYFKGKCEVVIEGSLFLTKENPSEIKKDFNKLKNIIKGKGAELVPDIAVYCDKDQRFKRGFLGIPQLVVEVLSPSNSEDDTIKKKDIYEEFGIPEYWIASPMSKKIYVYTLEANRYKLKGEYNFLEDEIKSSRFEELIIDIKDIDLIEDDEDDF
jgi:Uma2 family endonuclease